MIIFYRVLTFLLYPILIFIIYLRKLSLKEDKIRYKEKIFSKNFNVNRKNDTKLLWFHCASIGEFKSILPIIEEINKNQKNYEFLITTITLSSSKLARDELKEFMNVRHRFLPLDVEFLIDKFLSLWKPNCIFFVDSEIWPNLILKSNERKIPLILINGRITKKSFKKWMMIPNTAKLIFSKFNMCLCSNLETKTYLEQLDVKNIIFNGNIKLINKIDWNKNDNQNDEILKNIKFWIAASTHNGEELFCLETHKILKKKFGDIITIIAPRHINRSKEIQNLCKKLGLNSQILNKDETILQRNEIIIINSFGVLHNYFKHAKSVFVGKSIIKKLENVGGQSPIDAAKFGCKVYHGPYVYNFKEIYDLLSKNNIAREVNNSEELVAYLLKDFEKTPDENRKNSLLIDNLGQKILINTMKNIDNFLLNEIK